MNPDTGDDPGLDGPDYVALVIEWDDEEATIVRPREPSAAALAPMAPVARKLAAVLGALLALSFASWGLRKLRAS